MPTFRTTVSSRYGNVDIPIKLRVSTRTPLVTPESSALYLWGRLASRLAEPKLCPPRSYRGTSPKKPSKRLPGHLACWPGRPAPSICFGLWLLSFECTGPSKEGRRVSMLVCLKVLVAISYISWGPEGFPCRYFRAQVYTTCVHGPFGFREG